MDNLTEGQRPDDDPTSDDVFFSRRALQAGTASSLRRIRSFFSKVAKDAVLPFSSTNSTSAMVGERSATTVPTSPLRKLFLGISLNKATVCNSLIVSMALNYVIM